MTDKQSTIGLRRKDVVLAYTLLRILFGINFFNHGFTRIGNIGGFANGMVDLFKDTFMPAALVRLTGSLVPPVELIIGLLLLLGLGTRIALVAGFVLMMILHYGVTLLQNWDGATSQLIYCLVFFVLLAGAGFNTFSVDHYLHRNRPKTEAEKDAATGTFNFSQRLFSKNRTFSERPARNRKRFVPFVNFKP